MIDTIKLGIPLTRSQYSKFRAFLLNEDRWQWVQFNTSLGELKFLRHRGLAVLDKHSFHREIYWDIPETYRKDETYLVLEFSIPKFYYGHNIDLLYGFVDALEILKKLLQSQFHCRFDEVIKWQVFRADCCYAWRCPTQRIAQQVLDSLKHLHYPRKKPVVCAESIMFIGRTYSFKFYLKLPEFQANDKKALLKDKACLEWINHLEQKANGVLRCEATLRRQYLKHKNILTVNDLAGASFQLSLDDDFREKNPEIASAIPSNNNLFKEVIQCILINDFVEHKESSTLKVEIAEKGQLLGSAFMRYNLAANGIRRLLDNNIKIVSTEPQYVEFHDYYFSHNGGNLLIEKYHNSVTILNYFIKKFLGENLDMQDADKVKAKLLETYKPVKASRLVGFWLYVQRFGTNEAKQMYGHNSYYVSKRELKVAGVSLIEPPKNLDNKFLDSFKLEIPSSYCTNSVDNFRDSDNLINLPLKSVDNL